MLGIGSWFHSDKPEHLSTNFISPLGDQQYEISADAGQQKVNPTERLRIEIIERPKELKVTLKKAPMKKQSTKGEDMNKLKKLGEIINKAKLKSSDGATLNKGEKMQV